MSALGQYQPLSLSLRGRLLSATSSHSQQKKTPPRGLDW